MMLRVCHTVQFGYEQPAEAAAFVLHLRPRTLPWQRIHRFHLRPSFAQARPADGVDSFGNAVTRMFIPTQHLAVSLVAETELELLPRPAFPAPTSTPAWEHVGVQAQEPAAGDAACYAFSSKLAAAAPEPRRWAERSFAPGRPILACLLDLFARVPKDIGCEEASPWRCAPVAQVLQRQTGASQDLAHALIAGLRALRLPARFVSGYAGGQWRASVGCWIGPQLGWIDFDPVTGAPSGPDAICLGWGRDYADVSPVRGFVRGGLRQEMTVQVEIDRVALGVEANPSISQ